MEELKLKTTNALKHFSETPQTSGSSSKYTTQERQDIAKASKGFESLLTGMMLKSMTSTTEGFFGEDSYGGDFFDTIFNAELSSQISESQGLGIAEQIYKKITGEDLSSLTGSDKSEDNNPVIDKTEVNTGKDSTSGKNVEMSETEGFREIKPSNRTLDRVERFDDLIDKAADDFNIDRNIIKSIIMAESAGNEKAVSKANAKGLMQLMDGTASDMGVNNSFDPEQNIYGGTKYFSGLLRQYNGDLELSLAAYNAGPGNVQKYNGIPPFEETNTYVKRVIGYYNYFNG